jgi:hypothetical protein
MPSRASRGLAGERVGIPRRIRSSIFMPNLTETRALGGGVE